MSTEDGLKYLCSYSGSRFLLWFCVSSVVNVCSGGAQGVPEALARELVPA